MDYKDFRAFLAVLDLFPQRDFAEFSTAWKVAYIWQNKIRLLINTLKETVGDEKSGLVKDLKDLELKVSNLITDALAAKGEGTIDAAIAKQIQNTLENSAVIKTAIEAAISDVTGKVDKIDQELNSVLERIQSIVFVPQYKDNSGNAIVPVYKIDNKNGTVEMKFRISPIDKVAELVKLGTANPGIIFSRSRAM